MKALLIETDHGHLSATLNAPDNSCAALLLAHGAGADHKHAHMESLAASFAEVGIATLRFNFPFKERGSSRVDSKQVSVDCICQATEYLRSKTQLPLFVGGHSFGARMVTHAVAENQLQCDGLILCSFPLHPAGKPGVERAAHLRAIAKPVLFLSGTRDALAETTLLESQVQKIACQKLYWLDTADHSFKTLKRTRQSAVNVYAEAAEVAYSFIVKVTS